MRTLLSGSKSILTNLEEILRDVLDENLNRTLWGAVVDVGERIFIDPAAICLLDVAGDGNSS